MRGSEQKNCIQPTKLAKKEGEIRFHWQVAQFERLKGLLFDDSGEISVLMRGRFDREQRCLLTADVRATLKLVCQTSFEPIVHQLDSQIVYCTVVVESQMAEVEQEYEAVMVEDGLLDIKQTIEDELILSVPLAANKAAEDLKQKMSYGELDEQAIERAEKRANPFSVLTNLKRT